MRQIFLCKFGSHVYGTSRPDSDMDFKGVHLPSAEEILLQGIKHSIVRTTKEDPNAKNTADDTDFESYSIMRYLDLLCEGQTVTMDMLFTPPEHWEKSSSYWELIKSYKDKFISKRINSFVGYCRTQANKYGIKGSRVAAVRRAMDELNKHHDHTKIGDIDWLEIVKGQEHMSLEKIEALPFRFHLVVCNRKIISTANVKLAKEIYGRVLDEYGARALQAEKNEGVDWKAMMHAVRIGNQAIELLRTGNITFPRPEAPYLLKIRNGELPYKEVAEKIELSFEQMEEETKRSTLPELPDLLFAKQLTKEIHLEIVDEYQRRLAS